MVSCSTDSRAQNFAVKLKASRLTYRMQHLKLLSQMRGMQELQQGLFASAKTRGVGSRHGGDEFTGMTDEERLLKFQRRFHKAVSPQRVDYPIPADVTRKILVAEIREQ